MKINISYYWNNEEVKSLKNFIKLIKKENKDSSWNDIHKKYFLLEAEFDDIHYLKIIKKAKKLWNK
jgi:hypothetical protein